MTFRRGKVTGKLVAILTTLDLPKVFPPDATLTSEAVFAQSTAFSQLLKPTRQPLADALCVVVGVMVVR